MAVKFIRFKIDDVTRLPNEDGFYQIMSSRYWAVTEQNEILQAKGASFQCNTNKALVERLISFENHPGVSIKFIERVYLPHDCSDYA